MGMEVVLLHLLPALALLLGLWILPHLQGFNLVQHPAHTLRIAGVWQVLFSISMYSLVSMKHKKCQSILEAVGRSIFFLPIGALLMIIVAIIFGAPLDFDQGGKTAYWGQLISSLVVMSIMFVLCRAPHYGVESTSISSIVPFAVFRKIDAGPLFMSRCGGNDAIQSDTRKCLCLLIISSTRLILGACYRRLYRLALFLESLGLIGNVFLPSQDRGEPWNVRSVYLRMEQ